MIVTVRHLLSEAEKQLETRGFDEKARTVSARFGFELVDFSLINGQGLRGCDKWLIDKDDLRALRAAAAAAEGIKLPWQRSGLRNKKERAPRRSQPTLDAAQRRNLNLFGEESPIPYTLTKKGHAHGTSR